MEALKMSGRWILTAMIVGTLVMAGIFYVAIRQAPATRNLVTDQMAMEFRDYSHTIKHADRIKVAEAGTQSYFVNTQAPWKFEIHDKVLVVTAPAPEGEPNHDPLSVDQLPAARKAVEDFVWTWVEDKFHTRKDLQLEVHFLNEPQAH
jgi:hypothetical protein